MSVEKKSELATAATKLQARMRAARAKKKVSMKKDVLKASEEIGFSAEAQASALRLQKIFRDRAMRREAEQIKKAKLLQQRGVEKQVRITVHTALDLPPYDAQYNPNPDLKYRMDRTYVTAYYVGESDEDEEVYVDEEEQVTRTVRRRKGAVSEEIDAEAGESANAMANAVTAFGSSLQKHAPAALDTDMHILEEEDEEEEDEENDELYETVEETITLTKPKLITRKKTPKQLFSTRPIACGVKRVESLSKRNQRKKDKLEMRYGGIAGSGIGADERVADTYYWEETFEISVGYGRKNSDYKELRLEVWRDCQILKDTATTIYKYISKVDLILLKKTVRESLEQLAKKKKLMKMSNEKTPLEIANEIISDNNMVGLLFARELVNTNKNGATVVEIETAFEIETREAREEQKIADSEKAAAPHKHVGMFGSSTRSTPSSHTTTLLANTSSISSIVGGGNMLSPKNSVALPPSLSPKCSITDASTNSLNSSTSLTSSGVNGPVPVNSLANLSATGSQNTSLVTARDAAALVAADTADAASVSLAESQKDIFLGCAILSPSLYMRQTKFTPVTLAAMPAKGIPGPGGAAGDGVDYGMETDSQHGGGGTTYDTASNMSQSQPQSLLREVSNLTVDPEDGNSIDFERNSPISASATGTVAGENDSVMSGMIDGDFESGSVGTFENNGSSLAEGAAMASMDGGDASIASMSSYYIQSQMVNHHFNNHCDAVAAEKANELHRALVAAQTGKAVDELKPAEGEGEGADTGAGGDNIRNSLPREYPSVMLSFQVENLLQWMKDKKKADKLKREEGTYI